MSTYPGDEPRDDPDMVAAVAATPKAPGSDRITKMRAIVEQWSCMKIDGVLVDGFSASAYTQVWNRLKPANRVKLDNLPLVKAVSTVFEVIQKTGSR